MSAANARCGACFGLDCPRDRPDSARAHIHMIQSRVRWHAGLQRSCMQSPLQFAHIVSYVCARRMRVRVPGTTLARSCTGWGRVPPGPSLCCRFQLTAYTYMIWRRREKHAAVPSGLVVALLHVPSLCTVGSR